MADFAGTYTGDPNPRTMFVEGPFGAGKTTFAIETLFAWLESGIDPARILVLIPQGTLARPFLEALHTIRRVAQWGMSRSARSAALLKR
jgi:hypothetical protein